MSVDGGGKKKKKRQRVMSKWTRRVTKEKETKKREKAQTSNSLSSY